jgi:hypothetical protein
MKPPETSYIARQIELVDHTVDLTDYSCRTRQFHQHTIRTFYGFRVINPEARQLLLGETPA